LSIWILDDDRSIRFVLSEALKRAGLRTREFAHARELLDASADDLPELLFTDVRMPDGDGLHVLGTLKRRHPSLPVVVMSAYTDLPTTSRAFAEGAFEYLPKPFELKDAVQLAERALKRERVSKAKPQVSEELELLGESTAMKEVIRRIGKLAHVDLPVLISGETGTGKELVARALHRLSKRATQPFIALNTAAISPELLESELFGHEQGAFTGAHKRHIGRFEQAHRGTLFLDEIGDMPLTLQTRLLRVLAEGEFYRVGGRELVQADVRILAATHQDLRGLVQQQRFRADLLHRLDVVEITMPALRQRPEDVALLLRHYLERAAAEFALSAKTLSVDALRVLRDYHWPGNVRELNNIARRLTVLSSASELSVSDVRSELKRPVIGEGESATNWIEVAVQAAAAEAHAHGSVALAAFRDELELALMQWALAQTNGDRQRAAVLLKCGRNTLTRRLGVKR
jgi:two-component system nitrogen regulation response regulator GlnG